MRDAPLRSAPRAAALLLSLGAAACGRYDTDPPLPEPMVAITPAATAPAATSRVAPVTAPERAAPAAPRPTPAPAPAATAAAATGEGWNAAQIDWQPYEAGLARAKAQNKPVCLVFYTGWCPHCRNFSHIFDDPRIVARARDFVMIRVNADDESDLNMRFARDGGYIPRTFFLSPDGTLDPEIHAPRPKFLYFYDERDPTSLLGGMNAAAQKLTPKR